ncbi:MAG: ferric reductase-like transmembrane domain-containing protein, partial [Dehalococcoidia bacterium]
MTTQPATRLSDQPLGGSSGDWRHRLLFHHAPLALASAVVLVLFTTLPSFDANDYPPGDIFTGTFPKELGEGQGAMQHTGPQSVPRDPSSGQVPQQQGADHQSPQQHGGSQMPSQPSGEQTGAVEDSGGRASERSLLGLSARRFTVASGYVALVLLGLTLLVGPVNLLLRRRRPVSNYLARDVGTWAAVFSVVHVIYGVEVHGGLTLSGVLNMFILDGSPLTNSFGLANWTGLAATVIVVGLLAISSNFALRKLRARTWKNLQRLNYALFALVIVHAFFYGALLRLESPFTLLLGLSVIAVFVGQAVGIWLWRRRYARTAATQ